MWREGRLLGGGPRAAHDPYQKCLSALKCSACACQRAPLPIKGRFALANPHDFHTPKSQYSKDDLLHSGRGGYFGPGNAQLPAPPMLMMDRITEISLDGGEFGKGHVVAELDITPDLWFFDCDFVDDPVI